MGGINSVPTLTNEGKIQLHSSNHSPDVSPSTSLEKEEALQRATTLLGSNPSTHASKPIPIWLETHNHHHCSNNSKLPSRNVHNKPKAVVMLSKGESESTLFTSTVDPSSTHSKRRNSLLEQSLRSRSNSSSYSCSNTERCERSKSSLNTYINSDPYSPCRIDSASMLHSSVSFSSLIMSEQSGKTKGVADSSTTDLTWISRSESVEIPQRRRKKHGSLNSNNSQKSSLGRDSSDSESSTSSSVTNSPPQPLFLKYYAKKNNHTVSTQPVVDTDDLYDDYGKLEKSQRLRSQSCPNSNSPLGLPMKKVNSDNFGSPSLPIIVTPPPSSPEINLPVQPFRSVTQELQQAKKEKRAKRQKKLLEQQLLQEQQQQLLERSMNIKATLRSSSDMKVNDCSNSKKSNHADPAQQSTCSLPSLFEKVLGTHTRQNVSIEKVSNK
ncbi:hypothetical protein C9374_004358 [Naegleria lovaniensis]|uniref:Uncharacterized protein n=1 Tax=Naegleria lovaniensis TaxID=51637 RepID=A0AA88KK07_NAELO|nr:uncharacterized protein C9374_004358 [Naegleria lovaniensis]KAG2383687.1 hypothetical protein C9374_004358 [Naegleria lovaniensis]